MMIPDQNGIAEIFSYTIKYNLNLKTVLNWFLKFEKQTVFKIRFFSVMTSFFCQSHHVLAAPPQSWYWVWKNIALPELGYSSGA